MKIYNTNKKCEEEQIVSNETTLINNIGLTYPGTAMPLRPLTLNEHNSIRGINQMGLNVINPHYGYNATGCCGNDTLVIKGNLSVSGDIDFGGSRANFHDISANYIQYFNNSSFFTWGVHIIPKSGTIFTLAMRGLHTNPHYHVHYDHQVRDSGDPQSPRLPTPANPSWEGILATDAPAQGTTEEEVDTAGREPEHTGEGMEATATPPTTAFDSTEQAGTGPHSHPLVDHVHKMNHHHKINQDKCSNTHDHYIMDETRVWFEGWLYPGFGGYGNSTQSKGYQTPVDGCGNLVEGNFGNGTGSGGGGVPGGPGTDVDPSHNLTAFGARNGLLPTGDGMNGTGSELFPGDVFGADPEEYTGNTAVERPRLGGWSDRSSFPSCAKSTPDNSWELGYAIVTSIPFDGWLIADGSGSPFRNSTIWPHGGHTHANLNCNTCDSHIHHEHKGPSSRFSWMLGKYDPDHVETSTDFVLTIEFYIVRCDPENCGVVTGGLVAPEKIGTATIKKRCGCAEWGDGDVFDTALGTIDIKAGDGIGLYVVSNNAATGSSGVTAPQGEGDVATKDKGSLHSPATFTLEVHRKY